MRLNNALETSGIKTGNVVCNLEFWLFVIGAWVLVVILLILLLCGKKIRPWIEIKIKNLINKTFYNGIIMTQSVAYLQCCIAFGVSFYLIDWSQPPKTIAPYVVPVLFIILYPLFCVMIIRCYKNDLDKVSIKSKIHNLYANVDVKRSEVGLYYYPIWLIRRLFYVMIPLSLYQTPSLQLMSLLFLNLFYMMFYAGTRPHILKLQRYHEVINDIFTMTIAYHLLCFTWFVTTKKVQFLIGYSFLGAFFVILGMNIFFLVYNSIARFKSKRRKKAIQKQYE